MLNECIGISCVEYTVSFSLWSRYAGSPMKTLLLMRHGKSDWNAAFDHDHQRPLAERGMEAARRMGRFLSVAGEVPEAIVTSSAVRAEQTVRLASDAGDWGVPIRVTQRLYNSRPESVLDEVRAEPDQTTKLMIVGHEPTWSTLLTSLIGGGRHPFPTAAVVRIDLPAATWADVELGTGELRWLVTPRLVGRLTADSLPTSVPTSSRRSSRAGRRARPAKSGCSSGGR